MFAENSDSEAPLQKMDFAVLEYVAQKRNIFHKHTKWFSQSGKSVKHHYYHSKHIFKLVHSAIKH